MVAFPTFFSVFPPLLACEAPETAWFGALRFADTYCSAAWPPMVSGLELVTPRKDVAPQFLLTVSSETMGPDLSEKRAETSLKGNELVFHSSIFRCETLSFREG